MNIGILINLENNKGLYVLINLLLYIIFNENSINN